MAVAPEAAAPEWLPHVCGVNLRRFPRLLVHLPPLRREDAMRFPFPAVEHGRGSSNSSKRLVEKLGWAVLLGPGPGPGPAAVAELTVMNQKVLLSS